MTESFSYRGRTYLLTALLLVFCMLVFALFLVEQTRVGPMSSGEIVFGSLCAFFLAVIFVNVWSTSTITIDEHSVARVMFGRTLQELRWDAVGEIKFLLLSVPAPEIKAQRVIAIRPKTGRVGIGMSDRFGGFERFASLVAEIAQRRNIKVEGSDAYLRVS